MLIIIDNSLYLFKIAHSPIPGIFSTTFFYANFMKLDQFQAEEVHNDICLVHDETSGSQLLTHRPRWPTCVKSLKGSGLGDTRNAEFIYADDKITVLQ